MTTRSSPSHHRENAVVAAFISPTALEPLIAQATQQVMTSHMGALVQFSGVVRDHDGGSSVAALSYSAHPQAGEILEQIAQQIAEEFSGQVRLWAAHRVGDLAIGELAFVVLAASAHRAEAFSAASQLVDRVKEKVPIWKCQTLSDGRIQWPGSE